MSLVHFNLVIQWHNQVLEFSFLFLKFWRTGKASFHLDDVRHLDHGGLFEASDLLKKLWHYGHQPAWPGFGHGPLSGGPTESTDLRLGDSEVWAFQIWKITSFNESMSIYSILPLYFKIFNKMSKAKIQKDLNRHFQHNLTTNSLVHLLGDHVSSCIT